MDPWMHDHYPAMPRGVCTRSFGIRFSFCLYGCGGMERQSALCHKQPDFLSVLLIPSRVAVAGAELVAQLTSADLASSASTAVAASGIVFTSTSEFVRGVGGDQAAPARGARPVADAADGGAAPMDIGVCLLSWTLLPPSQSRPTSLLPPVPSLALFSNL